MEERRDDLGPKFTDLLLGRRRVSVYISIACIHSQLRYGLETACLSKIHGIFRLPRMGRAVAVALYSCVNPVLFIWRNDELKNAWKRFVEKMRNSRS